MTVERRRRRQHRKALLRLLTAFRHDAACRIVVGGICSDVWLPIQELRPGEKHVVLRLPEATNGGGAANSAVVHAALAPDRAVHLFAHTGADPCGQALRQRMAAQGITMPLEPLPDRPTSVSYIVSEASGRGTIFGFPGARNVPIPLDALERALPKAEALCLVAHPLNEQVADLLRLANQHQVPAYVGLGTAQIVLGYRRVRELLHAGGGAEFVMLNHIEAKRLTGSDDVREQLNLLRFGGLVRLPVISRAAHGLDALNNSDHLHVEALHDDRPLLDDTGAGDSAQAALVDSLLRGHPLRFALLAAARNGFEACTQLGCGSLSRSEMDDFLRKFRKVA